MRFADFKMDVQVSWWGCWFVSAIAWIQISRTSRFKQMSTAQGWPEELPPRISHRGAVAGASMLSTFVGIGIWECTEPQAAVRFCQSSTKNAEPCACMRMPLPESG